MRIKVDINSKPHTHLIHTQHHHKISMAVTSEENAEFQALAKQSV